MSKKFWSGFYISITPATINNTHYGTHRLNSTFKEGDGIITTKLRARNITAQLTSMQTEARLASEIGQ